MAVRRELAARGGRRSRSQCRRVHVVSAQGLSPYRDPSGQARWKRLAAICLVATISQPAGCPLRARDSVKLNRSALRDRLPRQMIVKRSKTANARRYWSFSAEMPLSFKLSSVSHTAYREPIGHAGLRGPAARYCFLILRRRRDG